jgi:hypothetical protein
MESGVNTLRRTQILFKSREGRVWTKENISQGHTIPTQCGLFVVSQ